MIDIDGTVVDGHLQVEEIEEIEAPPQLEGEERRKTLADILSLMEAIDSGTIEFTDEEVEDLMFQGKDKVDGCKFILDRYRSNGLFWQQEEYRAAAYRKRAENGAEKLQSSMIRAMDKNGFEKFPGHKWVLKKMRTTAVEVSGDISDMLVIKHPDLFKTTITAKAKEIGNVLKSGKLLDFARIKENFHVRFFANSEAKITKKTKKDILNEV